MARFVSSIQTSPIFRTQKIYRESSFAKQHSNDIVKLVPSYVPISSLKDLFAEKEERKAKEGNGVPWESLLRKWNSESLSERPTSIKEIQSQEAITRWNWFVSLVSVFRIKGSKQSNSFIALPKYHARGQEMSSNLRINGVGQLNSTLQEEEFNEEKRKSIIMA